MIIDDLLLCSVCFSAVNIADTLSTVWVAILSAASCGCCSISLAPAWVTPVTASDNVRWSGKRGESTGHWSDLHQLRRVTSAIGRGNHQYTMIGFPPFIQYFNCQVRPWSRSGEGKVIIIISSLFKYLWTLTMSVHLTLNLWLMCYCVMRTVHRWKVFREKNVML